MATRRFIPSGKAPHLRGLPGNAQELIGFQAGPADQRAVNLRFSHEFGDVARGNAAAVKDAEAVADAAAVEAGDHLADKTDGLIGLVTGGRFAGADGPDRL